jgi:hypothetical protein
MKSGPPCPSGPSSKEDRFIIYASNGIAFSILTGIAGGIITI